MDGTPYPDAWDTQTVSRIDAGCKSFDINAIIAYYDFNTEIASPIMASITIRNLEDTLKHRLRVRAAQHGRSMEEEVRAILREAVGEPSPPHDLAAAIRERVAPLGGIDLDIPERDPMREPIQFD